MRVKKSTKLICLAVVFLAVVLVGTIFVLLYTGLLQINDPDRTRFPIRGIDISHYQGEIDWERLKTEDIRFVFIKATEGGDHRDPAFAENWNKAGQAGISRGAYHFFTFCRTGKEQAQNFIATVPAEPGNLPPVIDLEFGGNCKKRPTRVSLHKDLNDFIAEIERNYRKKPIFYVKYDFYDAYIKDGFADYHLWIQDWICYPELSDRRKWTFWQYSIRGRISGVPTFVDLNVFNGSEEEFTRLIKSPIVGNP